MIKRFISYSTIILAILFTSLSQADTQKSTAPGCAQSSINVGDTSYIVTDKTGVICEDDIAGNMKDRLFSLGKFSVDKNNNSLLMFGEFIGVFLWYVIAIVLGIPAIYYLVKTAQGEDKESLKKLILTLSAILLSAIIAYSPISLAISNFLYKTYLYSANYSMRENINKRETVALEPKLDDSDSVINANVFANRLIQIALRNEFTERFINQAAYSKLGNDYEEDFIFYGNKIDISTLEFFKRTYSCNKIVPIYLVETFKNTENSMLDISLTKQNTEIQFNHSNKCADNYKYQKEIYGHEYSNGKIIYPTLNPIGKGYANEVYVKNIAASVQMINNLLDKPAGTVAANYGSYISTTESERMSIVNSGYVANYNEVKTQAAVKAAAEFMYQCAREVIDNNSSDSFWKTTLNDIPGAAPTIAIQAINKCRDTLLGSSRTHKSEILPIYSDAKKAAVEILKLKCNAPSESIFRKTSIINSNNETPYADSKQAVDAMTSLQTSCVSFNENGIFPNTSYTEEEREKSSKIIQEMKISITGYAMVLFEGRELAIAMLSKSYNSKFLPSDFSSKGHAALSPDYFSNSAMSDASVLIEANQSITPQVIVEGDLDFSTEASYLNEQILSANKGTSELIESLSNEKINISDYLDNGVATVQNNKYKIIDQTMPKNVQADLNLVKKFIREMIFSVSTTRLNNGLGFDYAGNILDLVELCKISSKQDCSNNRNNLAAALTGNIEMLKVSLATGVSLKIISKIGSEAIGKSNEVVGSITGNSKIEALTNVMKLLPIVLIKGLLASIDLFATLLLVLAALQAIFILVIFGISAYVFVVAVEMLIKCFILPIIAVFRIIKSGLAFDLEAFKFICVEVVLLIIKGFLMGMYIILISEFYSVIISNVMSAYFEIISNSRQNDSFIVSLFVDLSVFPVSMAAQTGCLLAAAYMFNILIKSIMIISDFKFGKSNDSGFAAATLLAVNANTVSKAADKISNAISRVKK